MKYWYYEYKVIDKIYQGVCMGCKFPIVEVFKYWIKNIGLANIELYNTIEISKKDYNYLSNFNNVEVIK